MSGIKDIWMYANNIIRSARQIINEELKPLNLTSAEGNILFHLLTQEARFRQEDIVQQLDISKPAVSRSLESLEKKRYISREKDLKDKRISWIILTDKAKDNGSKIEEIYNKVYSIATNHISKNEIDDFLKLFSRISDSFTKAQTKGDKNYV